MPDWTLRPGERVLLRRLPRNFASLPAAAQDLLDLSLGREFEVRGLEDSGLVELDISRVTRRELGSSQETIVVDSDCLMRLDR